MSGQGYQPGSRAFAAALAVCAAATAAFLLARLTAWPPHEDEALALLVARDSLGSLLDTVIGRRGGAPLHFLFAWAVTHAGGGLAGLRLFSALFAVASVPVCGLLAARLASRVVGIGAAALVSGSWIVLFHGIYARMYSLFLLTSALSYLMLLAALERGGGRRWLLYGLAAFATVAAHPYGALVLASQGVYVLIARRDRLREALWTYGALLVAGAPFWYADLTLAGRFDVGVGPGGGTLSSPLDLVLYLRRALGDMSVGWWPATLVVLALAVLGMREVRRRTLALALVVIGTPVLALLAARLGEGTSPESRHLIFTLPFVATLVAGGVLRATRRNVALAAAVVAVLVAGEVAWAWHKTPPLFEGEPGARVAARAAASRYLARTQRADDVLFGYEPLYLGAWEDARRGPRTIVPRADAKLALAVLRDERPLGRGVWVFDASENNNIAPKLTIERRTPYPHADFETHVFGPFLIVRTRAPTVTVARYLEQAERVQRMGKSLYIGDADVNFQTVRRAAARAQLAERSLSTVSR
jgi:hypothetical protein